MKKTKIFITAAFLAGVFMSSCSSDLSQPGEQNSAEDIYTSSKDLERGVNLIYSQIPASSEIGFNSIFTDEVGIGKSNGGQGLISGEYTFRMLTGNDFASNEWVSNYYMINRINRMIPVAEKLKQENPADEAKFNTALFELYVLRAYANLKLFSYFTPDYTDMNGLSVIKLDYVPTGLDAAPARATVSEIRQFILDDLNSAEALNASPRPGGSKAYVSPAVVDAIKVKLFTMTEEYSLIEPLVLPIAQNSTYSLKNFASPADFGNLNKQLNYLQFKDEENVSDENTDVIFKQKVTLNQGSQVVGNWYSVNVSNNGSPFYEMGRALYNEFDKLDPNGTGLGLNFNRNDVRYYINVLDQSTVATDYESLSESEYKSKDILLIGKYPGRSNAKKKSDMPLLRTPDLLLCLAEAKASQGSFTPASLDPNDLLGDYSTVYSIIFNIRAMRLVNPALVATTLNMPTITNSTQAYKAILDERRVEFAFEGHRYLDLKRIGAKAGVQGVDRYTKDCEPYGACSLPINDHRFTLPIPSQEINANPTIKDQQNPGY